MDVIVKLTVPNYIYRFYRNSAQHICGSSPETVMADALSAYAGLLSEDIAKQRAQDTAAESPENSSASRSR